MSSEQTLNQSVLGPRHDRERFACGVEALDVYFARQVTQDVRRRASACYVAVEAKTGKVAGYYTLAAGGVPLTDLPEALSKRLPRYPSVPVARVGRLAVDKAFHGNKLGGALLADAAIRATRPSRPSRPFGPCGPTWPCLPWWSMPRTMLLRPSTFIMGSNVSAPKQGS